MIVIIDYGMGNLRSVQQAFQKVGHRAIVTSDPEKVLRAAKVVLPGVGAFRDCIVNLKKRHLIDPIYRFIETGKPFLGICLGLQLLFTESEEGEVEGLDIIKGGVKRFKSSSGLKIPHMGWNQVKCKMQNVKCKLLTGIPDETYFYFVHSYYVEPGNKEIVLATTEYGLEFVSAISKDNIYGVQFHPEKSQEWGLKMLRNFGKL